MHFLKAGYRTVSLEHLIMVEDGREEPAPKAIPENVVRVTMVTGRVLDFVDEGAEVIRNQVAQLAVKAPARGDAPRDIPSHDVPNLPSTPGGV